MNKNIESIIAAPTTIVEVRRLREKITGERPTYHRPGMTLTMHPFAIRDVICDPEYYKMASYGRFVPGLEEDTSIRFRVCDIAFKEDYRLSPTEAHLVVEWE